MNQHDQLHDTGATFTVKPKTRTVTVPRAYRVIVTQGDHRSERITFRLPKEIDGHDITACAAHYVRWTNAGGESGRTELENLTVQADGLTCTWTVTAGVTAYPGTVGFSVCVEDTDADGALLYRFSTTPCELCRILPALDGLSTAAETPIPEGYVQPSGVKSITQNGTANVAGFATAEVSVPIPEGYIRPEGSTAITQNGTVDVAGFATAEVSVPTYITVASEADLPADAPEGTLALITGGGAANGG